MSICAVRSFGAFAGWISSATWQDCNLRGDSNEIASSHRGKAYLEIAAYCHPVLISKATDMSGLPAVLV